MNDLFSSFSPTSKEAWMALLQKELKGESLDALQKINKVEEIAFPSYFHREDQRPAFSNPGKSPFTRGIQADNNDWHIGTCFRIEQEQITNTHLLQALMSGTTSLVLHAIDTKPIDFSVLLHEIGLEYISTTFYPKTLAQATDFAAFSGNHPATIVWDEYDALLSQPNSFRKTALKSLSVNAYSVQQAGGTTWHELGFALAQGHELLVRQLDLGWNIDEAATNIHFIFGIGNKYFFEVCKFRAFRTAWARIVETYNPKQANSATATITAQTGFLHTSLKDPYTNLLRQTTQAMSAVVGGIQELVIQPYDWYASETQLSFTRRMATNISLLLKEESYLNQVIDPAGGSYALDNLTDTIAERAWASFREIERQGGITNEAAKKELSEAIRFKATQRQQAIVDQSEKLIGINVFPNPDTTTAEWINVPTAWNGLPTLILEKTL